MTKTPLAPTILNR